MPRCQFIALLLSDVNIVALSSIYLHVYFYRQVLNFMVYDR